MSQISRYPIADGIRFVSEHFQLDPKRAILKAGLPSDFLTRGERPVTAQEYYALWMAMGTEDNPPDFVLKLAKLLDEKAFDSSVYSFFSSPTVRIGLQRKALLKPLTVPLRMSVTDYDAHVALSFGSALPEVSLPPVMGWFDLTYFLLAIRRATGENVQPVAIQVDSLSESWDGAEDFFGCPISQGPGYRMILRAQDADLPLISRNDELWNQIEHGLEERFVRAIAEQSTAARVRQALVDGLPGGQATADQIAKTLAVSKRSLQRKLHDEGLSFKDVLEETRRAMAMNYLQNTNMNVQEIAYLLGFKDPSSFFRAFRSWTGHTPQALRKARA